VKRKNSEESLKGKVTIFKEAMNPQRDTEKKKTLKRHEIRHASKK